MLRLYLGLKVYANQLASQQLNVESEVGVLVYGPVYGPEGPLLVFLAVLLIRFHVDPHLQHTVNHRGGQVNRPSFKPMWRPHLNRLQYKSGCIFPVINPLGVVHDRTCWYNCCQSDGKHGAAMTRAPVPPNALQT
jgi:hypothetical protein